MSPDAREKRGPFNRRSLGSARNGAPVVLSDDDLGRIFERVLRATGVDLRFYKSPTIRRRIQKRIEALKLPGAARYADLLRRDAREVELLAHDVLIKVTSFFRDPEVFQALCANVIPKLLKEKRNDRPLRVWVPGCCSGEEVYSIAIAILECLDAKANHIPVQIFGTDVSEAVLERARAGVYPDRALANVSAERRERFFTKVYGGWQIHKNVRAMCTFARQDLTQDPPFSRIDLISCRNVLIYLGPQLQERIFSIFHYALNPCGHLMLGKSETIGAFFPELFSPADKRHNVYAKKASHPSTAHFNMHFQPPDLRAASTAPRPTITAEFDAHKEMDRLLLSRFVPATVLVNESLEVLHSRGDLSPFLRIPSGRITFSLVKMAREGLAAELKLAVQRALRRDRPVKLRGVAIGDARRQGYADVEVVALATPARRDRYALITFRASQAPAAPATRAKRGGGEAQRRQLAALKHELASTKAYLQSIIEEHEATNQELKSANEEVLSSNEELQSTNEEMETAKEELESTNEELTTVNEELETRNAELKSSLERLNESRSDLNEAQRLARIGSWKWYTSTGEVQWSDELYRIYGLRQGEPVTFERFLAFCHPEDRERVRREVQAAQERGRPFSFEHRILRPDGGTRTLHARGHALADADGRPLGMIGTGQDITDQKEMARSLQQSEQRFALLVQNVEDYAIFMLDPSGAVVTWNVGAERIMGYAAEEIVGCHFSRFYAREDREAGKPIGELREAAAKGRVIDEGWRVRKDGARFWVYTVITALRDPSGALVGFAKVTRDMTERRKADEALRVSEERFRTLVQSVQDYAIILLDPSGKVASWNVGAQRIKGYAADEIVGGHFSVFYGDEDRRGHKPEQELAIAEDQGRVEDEGWRYRKDGSRYWAYSVITALRDPAGGLVGFAKVTRDMTERRQAEEALKRAHDELEVKVRERTAALEKALEELRRKDAELRVIFDRVPALISYVDSGFRYTFANTAYKAWFGVEPESMRGKSVREVLGDEAAVSLMPHFRRALEGEAVTYEAKVAYSSGERWIHASYVPDRTEDGRVRGFFVFVDDISEVKRAAEALAESNEALETVNRVGQTLAAELDLDKLVQAITDAATRLVRAQFGAFFYNQKNERGESYTLYALSGAPREAFAKFPMPRNTAIFAPTFSGERTVRFDDVTRSPDYGKNKPHRGMPPGHLPVKSYLAVPVVSRTGEVLGGLFFGHEKIGVFRERDERIVEGLAAQAAIAIDNARLFEETRRAGEALRRSNEELVASNKELEQFAYVASHDLQEPLRKIMAFSERLKDRDIPGMGQTERDYFERMQSAAQRMKTLIEDLLNFSRVTTREALFEPVDLERVLAEVLTDLEARIAQRGATVTVDALPRVRANALQMRQLFQNLLGNSLKFAKPGVSPVIRVSARVDGAMREIAVADNGIGFDEKYLDRIFKPFQRLHGRSEYEGTGIGLAICQKILQRHGGTLTAKSRPGEGATFLFTLPAAD